jgi:AcrR family transcriptional regulator
MGIKERRDRERQELKQAILTSARAIAAAEGWQAVTIRRVADRIEYSPPTIYEHFANKEAIQLQITRVGFQALLAEIRAASVSTSDPAGRLLAAARAYWEFAWKSPELYQVMHGLGGVPFCAPEVAAAAGEPLVETEAVSEATAQIILRLPPMAGASPAEVADAVYVIWAVLHGLVALTMAGRIKGGQTEGRHLMEQAVRDFLIARGVAVDE